MATLNESQSGKAATGRTRKPTPRVDLTAMVDLAFLLITFFILTTTLAKFKSMDVAKSVPSIEKLPYPASRTMTIMLGKNNQAAYFMGEPEKADIKIASLSKIETEIAAKKLMVAKIYQNDPAKHLIIIIKPTETSTYKNFVDVIDEMKIADIKSYAIDDNHLSEREEGFMKENKI